MLSFDDLQTASLVGPFLEGTRCIQNQIEKSK